MSVTVCWSVKGGSGTTVVAATLALARAANSLLIDLEGDLPAVLGIAEPAGQGIGDWIASDAPVSAIAHLAVEVNRSTQLVPRGAVAVDRRSPRWTELGSWLVERPYTTVVDAGTGDPANPLGDV